MCKIKNSNKKNSMSQICESLSCNFEHMCKDVYGNKI